MRRRSLDRDDAPVSGGIGAVLSRGRAPAFSDAQDQAILVAANDALPELARLYGVPFETVTRRRQQLEARARRIGG